MPNSAEFIAQLAKQLERTLTLHAVLELAQDSKSVEEIIEKIKILIIAAEESR